MHPEFRVSTLRRFRRTLSTSSARHWMLITAGNREPFRHDDRLLGRAWACCGPGTSAFASFVRAARLFVEASAPLPFLFRRGLSRCPHFLRKSFGAGHGQGEGDGPAPPFPRKRASILPITARFLLQEGIPSRHRPGPFPRPCHRRHLLPPQGLPQDVRGGDSILPAR